MTEQGQIMNEKLRIVCTKCGSLCFDIEMKKLDDGNDWSDDTCWKCGEKLPKVAVVEE